MTVPADTTPATDTKDDFVPKKEFQDLHSKFSNFTDLVTKHLIKDDMRDDGKADTTKYDSNAGDVHAKADTIEEDDLDLDPKTRAYIDKKTREAREEAKNILNVSAESERKKLATDLDNEAYSTFPQLKDQSDPLYKMTTQIIAEQKRLDPKAKDRPDLVLSSALIAKKRLEAQEKTPAETTVDRPKRFDSMSVEVGGTTGGKIPQNKRQETVSDNRLFFREHFRG
jgi:hypothetical protein